MPSTTFTASTPRPRSPWPGSQHHAEHRWQLDGVTSLAEVTRLLTALAAELTNAHRAGWWLVEPMRDGYLAAARACWHTPTTRWTTCADHTCRGTSWPR
jgi:hypothetical protein